MKIDCGYAENYIKERARMTNNCGIACDCCPFESGDNEANEANESCVVFERKFPDKAIAIVQKWSDEHPIETRAEHLLKMIPTAQINKRDKVPKVCLKNLNPKIECKTSCKMCWQAPYKEGEF